MIRKLAKFGDKCVALLALGTEGQVFVIEVTTPRLALGIYAWLRCTHFTSRELVFIGPVFQVNEANQGTHQTYPT